MSFYRTSVCLEFVRASIFLFFLARSHSLSLSLSFPPFSPSPNRAFVFFSYFSHWKKSQEREEKCLFNDERYSAFLRVEIKRWDASYYCFHIFHWYFIYFWLFIIFLEKKINIFFKECKIRNTQYLFISQTNFLLFYSIT